MVSGVEPRDSTALPSLARGSRVGPYRVHRMLARGGMGEIYLAEGPKLGGGNQYLALKRLMSPGLAVPDQARMFLEEARLTALLRHPNIVQVFDVGCVDGIYYMAQEYLHGEDVRAILKETLLRGEKVPLAAALAIAMGACAGMHHAHELAGADGKPLDIVHRDISPDNVFVTYGGEVKIIDFGVARAVRRDCETTTRTMKGKIGYMSPEQCLSQPIDRRSDIFSLGVMLYELTLGTRLFRGNSDYELMQQIVDGAVVRPRQLDPRYPEALEAALMRALKREPDERQPTARVVHDELQAVARGLHADVSAAGLARFMHDTFGSAPEAWRELEARPNSLITGPRVAVPGPATTARQAALGPLAPTADALPAVPAIRKQRGRRLRARIPGVLADIGVAALLLAFGAVVLLGLYLLTRPRSPGTEAAGELATAPAPIFWAAPDTETLPPRTDAGPGHGTITITATRRNVAVLLDGKPVGQQAPVTIPEVDAGIEHRLEVRFGPGLRHRVEKRFTLNPDETLPLHFDLAAPRPPVARPSAVVAAGTAATAPPAAKPGAVTGSLRVEANPRCRITIDDKPRGVTPSRISLPVGPHKVVLTDLDGQLSRRVDVQIKPAKVTVLEVDFLR